MKHTVSGFPDDEEQPISHSHEIAPSGPRLAAFDNVLSSEDKREIARIQQQLSRFGRVNIRPNE